MGFAIEADDVAVVGSSDQFSRPNCFIADCFSQVVAIGHKHKADGYEDDDTDDELVLAIDFFHD